MATLIFMAILACIKIAVHPKCILEPIYEGPTVHKLVGILFSHNKRRFETCCVCLNFFHARPLSSMLLPFLPCSSPFFHAPPLSSMLRPFLPKLFHVPPLSSHSPSTLLFILLPFPPPSIYLWVNQLLTTDCRASMQAKPRDIRRCHCDLNRGGASTLLPVQRHKPSHAAILAVTQNKIAVYSHAD